MDDFLCLERGSSTIRTGLSGSVSAVHSSKGLSLIVGVLGTTCAAAAVVAATAADADAMERRVRAGLVDRLVVVRDRLEKV